MSGKRNVNGFNLNFLGLVAASLTAAATTVTLTAVATGGILTVARNGIKATLSAGAKSYLQKYGSGDTDSTTRTLVASSTAGQAAIVVHCLQNISGTETLVQVVGPVAAVGASNVITSPGGLIFPAISDALVPVAYSVVTNPVGSSTATFTFGSTNWNATSIATTTKDISQLPDRPLTSVS